MLLLDAVRERLGADAVVSGHALSAFEQDDRRSDGSLHPATQRAPKQAESARRDC